MKYMHSEWQRRLAHWQHTLQMDFYFPLGSIDVESFFTTEHLTPEEAQSRHFEPMSAGTTWGHSYEYCWMHSKVILPLNAAGKRIVMDLNTGGETTVFINGKAFGTYRAGWVETPHHFIEDNVLTKCGKPGQSYDILLEAYAGHFFPSSSVASCATGPVIPGSYTDPKAEGQRATLGSMTYGIWNEDAYQLYMDLDTLCMLGDQVDQESLRADKIAAALEDVTLIVDFEQPLEKRIESYKAAREALKPVLNAVNGSTVPMFYAIGNSHLDLAWLWPMAETHRKTARTFAAQLRLIDEYPDYRYLQSQPASYVMCKEHYPELYERIKEAIKKGQWIAEGAMWVEPDTNMTSGESLIRQLIHGKRFFKDELGVDSKVLWLPDTFGYSAALPQILKGCGIKHLVTQKIFWSYNEGDQFPYHYFTWQGADGSEIVSFLPTSYTYFTHPKEICETWKKRVQKRGLNAFLLPYGYGDGGGGPTRDHLEYLEREKDLEGMPRVKQTSIIEFFEDMEAMGGPQHTYVGELYFSAHRGVYTSQAAIKKGNRKAELALREAEMWGVIAMLHGAKYPLARMDAAWKKLLLNQFHDILPGSSIARVYEDARRDHRWIQNEAEQVRDAALAFLAQGDGITVFNSLSFDRSALISLPDEYRNGAITSNGTAVPVQASGADVLALVQVPACGAVTLLPAATAPSTASAHAVLTDNGAVIENAFVRAELNSNGEIISFIDKSTGREFSAGTMNRFLAYKDVPRTFDAWDIDSNYILQPVAMEDPVEITVKEAGGLRAVLHVSRRIMNSVLEQDIELVTDSRRIDFKTKIDWHELHRLLKVSFPVNVNSSEGINEIQFGYMMRPTHRSRLYDSDRFEVCNQRYSALCDQHHGAAILNDCKYGISMNGNAMELTLLRAAASPEMRADNGEHTFTYAFTVWEGSFYESPVTEQAYALNVPVQVVHGSCPSFSAFRTDAPNVFIDTIKPAEDGSGDIILRLYESKKADTVCSLHIDIPAEKVWLCDMLENQIEQLNMEDGQVKLQFGTFEVKTLRISKNK